MGNLCSIVSANLLHTLVCVQLKAFVVKGTDLVMSIIAAKNGIRKRLVAAAFSPSRPS
ncbi:MAG: hypothetical protein WBF33_00660 [Candidatus Nitrosopolaris sp.]